MAPFKALYGRKCRSPLCWSDISDTIILGPQLIEETTKKVREIQAKIQAAQDRKKSYTYLKRREEEFEVGDKLRMYIPNKSHVLQPKTIELDHSLTKEERPVKILDSKVRSTRKKDVKIVKVLWSNQENAEAT
ncbi:uncharacterized protein LOC110689883 [Chenopodium quinoa]|uniref:uncharacterized protein LOC110689883 n=1 Tax=Chenopodium quinoa TaxID=63459 RepID=UPI000B792631|nr:uncharacterized protein LOC110689883 [Chenopodium quinoa]